MPIYEFHCKECRRDFKTLRRAEQVDSVKCPECGTVRVVKMLSVTAQVSSKTDAGACCMPGMGGCCAMNPDACGCRN